MIGTTRRNTREASRRTFLATPLAALASAEQRPNILLIMCDQLTASVTSVYGGPVPTPNLERLARRGVVFTQATCATPFCSPTRASILTGRYPHNHGIVYNVNRIDYPAIPAPATEQGITVEDVTTDKILHNSGYATHHYGKWHLAGDRLPYHPDPYGEHHEYAREMAAVFEKARSRPRESWMNWYGWAMPVTVSPDYRRAIAQFTESARNSPHVEFVAKFGRLDLPLEQVFDVRVAQRAVSRLRDVAAPFMITCSFNYPHDPNVVPSPYYDSFPPEKVPLPASFGNCDSRFEKDWSRRIVSASGETGAREFLRVYHGSTRLLDDQVGKVLDALDATGRAESTVVVFTSDHGDMAGGHGMVWKSTSALYDEIVRVPLIVSWPERIRPARTDMAASHVDLMPTLLDLAGRRPPAGIDGISLAPYLLGARSPGAAPPYRFCERVEPNRTSTRTIAPGTRGSYLVRGAGWKYAVYPDGGEYLYDLKSDPHELNNRASDPACRGRKAELRQRLIAWLPSRLRPA